MTNIVKGLRYQFTTAQLGTHMRDRADYHESRASEKEKALPELQKAVDIVKQAGRTQASNIAAMSKFSNSNYNFDVDQVEQLETDIKDHRNKALVFRTLADHLVLASTYDLDENDLRRLEIIK